MKIIFTKRAGKNFNSIYAYITMQWGENVAKAFEQKFKDLLALLKDFPEMGSNEVPEKQIRGFQLTKQTRVFYRIKNEKIIILALFNVRQDLNKKPK